jgi:hypothetical protein
LNYDIKLILREEFNKRKYKKKKKHTFTSIHYIVIDNSKSYRNKISLFKVFPADNNILIGQCDINFLEE